MGKQRRGIGIPEYGNLPNPKPMIRKRALMQPPPPAGAPHIQHPGTIDRMVGGQPSLEGGLSNPQYLPSKAARRLGL